MSCPTSNGVFIGFNRSTFKPVPVFINLHGATQSNQSGCVAVVGDLGKGKSVILSEPMEDAEFARSLAPDSTAVVEILQPAFSLDSLHVFTGVADA